jgi:hypothetical protein
MNVVDTACFVHTFKWPKFRRVSQIDTSFEKVVPRNFSTETLLKLCQAVPFSIFQVVRFGEVDKDRGRTVTKSDP